MFCDTVEELRTSPSLTACQEFIETKQQMYMVGTDYMWW